MPELGPLERIAEAGKRLYEEKRAALERDHRGHFVAVDVVNETIHVGETADAALLRGRKESPHGVFHLIRIGSPGAQKAGYIQDHVQADLRAL